MAQDPPRATLGTMHLRIAGPWPIACAVAVVLVAARAALQAFAGTPWQPLATDVHGILRTALVAAVLAWAARRVGMGGAAWGLMAAGVGCWLVADILWLVLAILGRQPWGSVADLFFLACYPLLFAGVLLLPRRHPAAGGTGAAVVDLAVVAVTAAAALWLALVQPLWLRDAAAGLDARLIAVAYPIGDLLLLWVAGDLFLRGRVRAAAGVPLLIAGAAAVLIAADLVYAVQVLDRTYTSGNPLGIAWTAGLVLLGLAGVRGACGPAADTPAAHDARMTSALVAAAALVALWCLLVRAPADPVVAAAGLAGAGLLVLRQVLTVAANRRLERALHRANAELEERVRARTAELAEAQRRLAEAERLEAVGRVAGAVAHDFNNILTAVSGHAELARLKTADPVLQQHLDQIHAAGQRAAELARRLMASARPPRPEPRAVDLPELVREVVGQVGPTLPPGITVGLALPEAGAVVQADPGQLHQVLMNLCVNARDAMPAGGRLELAVARIDGWVELTVADTGQGMDESVRARLFEPYFTTKEPGKGNGLGLATVRAIVRQHQGTITVASAPGAGARFTVRLPAA
jgi:signal transduction histidine kinase